MKKHQDPEVVTVEELGWIKVDPAVSFAERVKRGNYAYVNPKITEKASSSTRKVRRRIVLYDSRGLVSAEEMKQRIRANGDEPASLDDALEVGFLFPDRQRKNSIVFINEDSVCKDHNGSRCAPVLSSQHDSRKLRLDPLAGAWREGIRFAAIREEEYLDT